MARLVCEKGPLEGQTFEVEQGVTVGRGPQNAIPMPKDRKASRDHAKLWRVGVGQYAVADLGSTNGTLVNDETVSRHNLKDGDYVQIGEAVFRFELGDDERPKPKVQPKPAAAESGGERQDLASLLRGESKPSGAPSAGAPGEPPKIEVKSRILQYNKKSAKGTALGVDVSQTAGIQRLVMVLIGLAVFAGLFFVVKSMVVSGRQDAANEQGP